MARAAPCDRAEARTRLATARAYLETAELVLGEDLAAFANVAAGNAILAGIAAGDVICCVRLSQRHRGEDHLGAVAMLERATPDGHRLGQALRRLLGLKDTAHYDARLIDGRAARDAVLRAERLVARAGEELER